MQCLCERLLAGWALLMHGVRKQSTGSLTTAKRNIAETLVKIESIHENFRVASQTESVIAAGLKVEDPSDFYRVSPRSALIRELLVCLLAAVLSDATRILGLSRLWRGSRRR